MSILGCIADVTTVDTVSANPSATYPIQSHGGKNMTCSSIYSNGAKITHLDPITDPTDVTGVPIQPLVPPVPQPLPRTAPIVGIVNSVARGVYFEDVLVPVIGDGINAPLATPEKRPLTTPTLYPTIHIGTRT
tara:strand:+ start:161 stop:559 length:399 start_codon:yes stop_codon:yes gene_type:complete